MYRYTMNSANLMLSTTIYVGTHKKYCIVVYSVQYIIFIYMAKSVYYTRVSYTQYNLIIFSF